MNEFGLIRLSKKANHDFYASIYYDAPIYFDTGGLYYYSNDIERNSLSIDDPRIKYLKFNGIIIKSV